MAAIHLGDGLLRRSSNQPGRSMRNTPAVASAPPLFGLAPGGVCHADPVTSAPVRFYRTLSPLPVRFRRHRRYTLCGTFPGLRGKPLARRALPATLVSWSPDFPRHLRDAAARPPGAAYLVNPRSRSKRRANSMARISPSISPSIRRGRQRRWKAATAARPSAMS